MSSLAACSSAGHPSAAGTGNPSISGSADAAPDDATPGDPWDGDPFADTAPPYEPADASYLDPADGGAVTWESWVSGFSNVYCVACHNPQAPCGGSGCHSPSDPQVYALSFDMREKSSWTSRSATIKCGIVVQQDPSWSCGDTTPETYPKMAAGYPLPSADGRATVAAWIEAGCP
jgi:hypothetical protein